MQRFHAVWTFEIRRGSKSISNKNCVAVGKVSPFDEIRRSSVYRIWCRSLSDAKEKGVGVPNKSDRSVKVGRISIFACIVSMLIM